MGASIVVSTSVEKRLWGRHTEPAKLRASMQLSRRPASSSIASTALRKRKPVQFARSEKVS